MVHSASGSWSRLQESSQKVISFSSPLGHVVLGSASEHQLLEVRRPWGAEFNSAASAFRDSMRNLEGTSPPGLKILYLIRTVATNTDYCKGLKTGPWEFREFIQELLGPKITQSDRGSHL